MLIVFIYLFIPSASPLGGVFVHPLGEDTLLVHPIEVFPNKKGPKKVVNRRQLFDLKKSQGDPLTSDPSIKGPKFDPKVIKKLRDKPQISHPYGTRSKT